MPSTQEILHERNVRAARREAVRDYQAFMRLKASAHQIHMYIQQHRLTPGIDWQGSSKRLMAAEFATRSPSGCGNEVSISQEVFQKLVERFGLREE